MDNESLVNLAADENQVSSKVTDHGGQVHKDPHEEGVYWIVLYPKSNPDETYIVRIKWTRYPQWPPSVKFADRIGGSLNVTKAWPRIPGYRPGNFDICKPFTAEAFALHPEWNKSAEAWRSVGSPFLWVIDNLQTDLDLNYGGRSE